MAQQLVAAEYHQGRAVWYWVSFSSTPPSVRRQIATCLMNGPDEAAHRAALCQIFDSIYLDIPMARVKFNVNTEYAYLQNFKILQSASNPPFSLPPFCTPH